MFARTFFVTLVTLAIVALLEAGHAHAAAAATVGPAGRAFYVPPSPLPPGVHGDVIWSRPLQGPNALVDAEENTLVLYRTTTVLGTDVAVSGAIAIPKGVPPAGGWPVVSWAHGTTGNGQDCAPTRSGDSVHDEPYFDAWVAHGYVVVQTDYEGQGTPGLHPYMVGIAAARDTTDIVRAARQLDPRIGSRWFALGYSEGGSASIFTAAVGPSWAPELTLLGAVSFAPASHNGTLVADLAKMTQPSEELSLILEMIEGVASVDPAINLQDLLTPEALGKLPMIARKCMSDLVDDFAFTALPPSDILRPGADTQALTLDLVRNEANRVHATVPLLLLQGDADRTIPLSETTAVARELCANGTRVTYEVVHGKTHGTIVPGSWPQTLTWVDAVAAGNLPAATCV
jgi:dienelactone hydrolase